LNRGKIGTNNPSTHASTDFATPADGSERVAITVKPDGNLWFTEAGVEKFGVLTPTLVFVATVEPPAFVAPGAPFGLTITVAYLSGPTDTGFNGNLTLALFNPNTNGAALRGTLTHRRRQERRRHLLRTLHQPDQYRRARCLYRSRRHHADHAGDRRRTAGHRRGEGPLRRQSVWAGWPGRSPSP
jgi:hypothetical protein